jgi:hypothetical protein
MNIFVLDQDPALAAQYHNDKHVVKMLLESAQLLCTAVNHHAAHRIAPYRSTHINHPCAVWTRESVMNFKWVYDLMSALNQQYRLRYGNGNHLSYLKLTEARVLSMGMVYLPTKERTEFVQVMPDNCKLSDDPVTNYREYYRREKQHIAQWTCEKPEWY